MWTQAPIVDPDTRPRTQRTSRMTEAMASEVAAAAGIPESDVVRFDTNTSAWPPVAWERTSLDAPRLPANEYPHPSNEPLRSALAKHPQLIRRLTVLNAKGERHLKLKGAEQRCVALEGTLGKRVSCTIYQWRPAGCRAVVPGSRECRRDRRERGIDPK